MTEMTWELLTKIYDRIEAEMMKAALEALGYKVLWIDLEELTSSPEEVVRRVIERLEEDAN